MNLEIEISRILQKHKHKCKFKETVEEALSPFIIIDSDCKARDVADFLRKKYGIDS